MTRRSTEFKVDGKDYKVYEPSFKDNREAQKARNVAFHDAIESNAMLRDELQAKLKEKGSWTEAQDKEYEELGKKIADGSLRITEGGFKLKEARTLAIQVATWRNARRDLLMELSKLDNTTAEGQSENAAFNYLVSACLVYNEGGKELPYFSSMEDYLNRGGSEIASTAANTLASLLYDIGTDAEKNLPENKFLLEYGFVNDELEFINEEGKNVDADGRLINDDGRLINADGEFIDVDGNLITEDGQYKVEFKGFTDDDGAVVKPNVEDEPEDETATAVVESAE